MFKLIGALLVGILSASLAVIYQNDIAAFVGRAPVTVRVTAGGWYPHAQSADAKQAFSEIDQGNIALYGSTKESDFARVTITNNTGRDIPNAYIRFGEGEKDTWKFDAVVLKKESGKDQTYLVNSVYDKIDVGSLPAAQDTTVYLWTNRGFGYPFGVDDLEVLTTDGSNSKSVTKLDATSDELMMDVSTETIAWVFVFVLLIVSVLMLISMAKTDDFIRKLFGDDDYYLSERMRYEADPKKYVAPQ